MSQALNRLQNLLGELFQLDAAGDLDFGIYRIMNHKRDEIDGFIENSLPRIVEDTLSKGSAARQTKLAGELREKAEQAKQTFGEDAISPDGDLSPTFQNTPLGKDYLELRERAEGTTDLESLKATVFNHLYTFFSRYYEGGDFLSQRRYSKQQKYAIPYNGEEVYLHWANADQYYIKTGEHFTNYQFTVNDVTVHFKLVAADVEKNNVKGKDRYFLPRTDQAEYDEDEYLITIPFEHRPLTDKEESRYGAKNGRQGNVNEEAVTELLERFNDSPEAARALEKEKRRDSENRTVSHLQHHLRRYTAKNNSDFFVHKDLRGFLEGELDFYLKNEVINIDDLDSDRWGEERAKSWFEVMQAMKRIGREIIAFLAQIEDYQKKLFEKKKFVTRSDYCLTLDNVPEDLYPEVLENNDQFDEWERLFKISSIEGTILNGGGTLSEQWLRDNPYLVLDTKFFDESFKDRLLGQIEDLDERTDGVLVNSENFQALNLLQDRYREQVKCIYIDPPYNTGSSAILYKNNYRHSSWLTLMYDRLAELKSTLTEDGAIFVSIDKTERTMLEHAMDKVFGPDNRIEELIWSMNTNNSQAPNYSTNHEYVEAYAKNRHVAEQDREMFREPKPGFQEVMALIEELNPSYPAISTVEKELQNLYEQHKIEYQADGGKQKGDDPWKGLFNYSHAEYRDLSGNLVPESEAKEGQARIWIWQEDNSSMPATKQAASTHDSSSPNWRFYKPLHPVTGKPTPHPKSGWKWAYADDEKSPDRRSFVSLDRDGRIAWGKDENKVPRLKRMLHEVETNVGKSVFQDYSDGEKQTSAIFGRSGVFLAPKHSSFVSRFILHAAERDSTIIDCFGGSGSTAHAVINLNREDGGNRKYILAEMGEYFDTVLKPRIQKVIYSKDWKEGRPISREGTSHIFKYLSLEQYEDTLSNISFTDETRGQNALEMYGDDYLLRYMLDFETQDSETLLNVGHMDSPFRYGLTLYDGEATREMPVDLPETFNYLLGMRVKSRKMYYDGERRYLVYQGSTEESGETVVIWRNTEGWEGDDYRRDEAFVMENELTGSAKQLFVNGDSFIPEAKPLEPVFKQRMLAEPVNA